VRQDLLRLRGGGCFKRQRLPMSRLGSGGFGKFE
jgi:hypothetical protein